MFLATYNGHFWNIRLWPNICNFIFWGNMYMAVQPCLFLFFWHKKSIKTSNFSIKLCQMIFGHNYQPFMVQALVKSCNFCLLVLSARAVSQDSRLGLQARALGQGSRIAIDANLKIYIISLYGHVWYHFLCFLAREID